MVRQLPTTLHEQLHILVTTPTNVQTELMEVVLPSSHCAKSRGKIGIVPSTHHEPMRQHLKLFIVHPDQHLHCATSHLFDQDVASPNRQRHSSISQPLWWTRSTIDQISLLKQPQATHLRTQNHHDTPNASQHACAIQVPMLHQLELQHLLKAPSLNHSPRLNIMIALSWDCHNHLHSAKHEP